MRTHAVSNEQAGFGGVTCMRLLSLVVRSFVNVPIVERSQDSRHTPYILHFEQCSALLEQS